MGPVEAITVGPVQTVVPSRRMPRSQRYELTGEGRRLAVFFSKTYTRIVCPSLAELDPSLPDPFARRTALGRPWREFERALDADRRRRARGLKR